MNVKQAVAAVAAVVGLSGGLAACGGSSDASTAPSQIVPEETPDQLQQMLDWQSSIAADPYVQEVVYNLGQLEMFEGQTPGDVGMNANACGWNPEEYQGIPDAYQAMIDNAPQPPVDPGTFKKAEQAYLEGMNHVCDAVGKWDMDWKQHREDVAKVNASFERSAQLQEKWYDHVTDQVPDLVNYLSEEDFQSPWDPQLYN
jgi:hypothetical protein